MIESLTAVADNIWIPHQVALEFHRNRVEAARDQLAFYDETCKSLETARNQAFQRLNEFANRSALDDGEKKRLKSPLEHAFTEAIERVRSHQGVFDLTISRVLNDDPIMKALMGILDGRVGPPLGEEAYVQAQAESAHRRENRIPPGYKDGTKRNNIDGDYLWWEQTLIQAESVRKPVLIISNDDKEDWMHKRLDFSLGPREELVEEMRQRADVSLRIVTFAGFLEGAKSGTSVSVSRETLSQANVARERGAKQSRRLIASPAAVSSFQEFAVQALGGLEQKISETMAERAEVAGDADMEEMLDTQIRDNQHAMQTFQRWLSQLQDAISEAATLKGDMVLHIEDETLRHVFFRHARDARNKAARKR